MNIGVIGVGRLGICFALLLERAGHTVLASDIKFEYVDNLNVKRIKTSEPGVQELLSASSPRFRATISNSAVADQCDIFYVIVATPSLPDGSYDVRAVWNVIDDIKKSTSSLQGKTFVVGCTVNPGDCARFQQALDPYGVDVLYNPEFIAQGSIIKDLQQADMVLIGGNSTTAVDRWKQVYHNIQTVEPNIHTMSLNAAEIVKIAINCYLTTKISYANLIGEVMIMSGLEKEIDSVLSAIGQDTRIGQKYLKFGYGFGGPCLPRDNRSFGHYVNKLGLTFNLGTTVDTFNQDHAKFLKNHFVWANRDQLPFYMESISYKKNTDMFEESQQFQLCKDLLSAGYAVYIEPNDLIPSSVVESLIKEYGRQVLFVSRQQLEGTGVKFFEVTL